MLAGVFGNSLGWPGMVSGWFENVWVYIGNGLVMVWEWFVDGLGIV